METCFVFDIDGTLINSKHAVELAYARAGVVMPRDAWGKAWSEWLIPYCGGDREEALGLHKIKNEYYPEALAQVGKPTPIAGVAKALIAADNPVFIITGGSENAAKIVLDILEIDVVALYDYELSVDAKTRVLADMQTSWFPRGVYFDDLDGVRVPAGWYEVRVRNGSDRVR